MKLLLTGAYKWEDEQIEFLKNCGWEILYSEREDSHLPFDKEEIDAVVCNWLFFYHNIREFKRLKCVQLLSAGVDRVPNEYIIERNIKLFNARGVYSIPIAEFVVSSTLQIYKQSRFFFDNQNNKIWSKNRNVLELSGKRICIIGAGSVGNEVAKRFSAFTDEIYGVDICPKENNYMKNIYPLDCMDRELALSDIVVLTLPLTDKTKNLFSKDRFEIIKKNSVFINVARGEIVDEIALADALDNRLLGAVSDVFCMEPLPVDSLLWTKKNIIITPHNSFVSENNHKRMWELIKVNLSNPLSFI